MGDNNDDQVPGICEPCLGDNPYLRMTRDPGGEQCNICQQAYTAFRWVQGRGQPWKKTTICKPCARVKNCCQSCMLDLTYGLPIAIRDEALKLVSNSTAIEGSTDVTRLYAIQQERREEEENDHDDQNQRARDLLRKLAQAHNSKNTNSDGRKSLVDEMREQAEEEEGQEDGEAKTGVVAAEVDKVAHKLPFHGSMAIPQDAKLCSFFVFGIDEELSESDIRKFFAQYGDVKSMQIVHRAKCGFVNFNDRQGAETAAKNLPDGKFVVKGCKLKCAWGKPRPLGLSHSHHVQLANLVRKAMKGKVKQKKKTKPVKQAEAA